VSSTPSELRCVWPAFALAVVPVPQTHVLARATVVITFDARATLPPPAPGFAPIVYVKVVGLVTVIAKVPLYAAAVAPEMVTLSPVGRPCDAAVVAVATAPTRVMPLTAIVVLYSPTAFAPAPPLFPLMIAVRCTVHCEPHSRTITVLVAAARLLAPV